MHTFTPDDGLPLSAPTPSDDIAATDTNCRTAWQVMPLESAYSRRIILGLLVLAAVTAATMTEHLSSTALGERHPLFGTMTALLVGLVFGACVIAIDRFLAARARIAERALDLAGEGYLILDRAGCIRSVNAAYCGLTGRPMHGLLRHHVGGLSAIDSRHATQMHLASARSNGYTRFDTAHRTITGHVPVQVTLAWIDGESHFVMFVRDRSSNLAIKQALDERNERLTRVLDATAEGIYGIDAQGRCTFVNARALFLLGYEGEDQLLGRDVHDLIHHHRGCTPHEHEAMQCAAHRALRGEHTIDGVRDMFWRRGGTPVPVVYRSCPIRAHDGASIVGAVVSFTDCSAEVALRESADRDRRLLAMVVDAVGEALILLDEHSRIAMFNAGAERIFARLSHDVIGESVDQFLSSCTGRDLIDHVCEHIVQTGPATQQPCTRLLEGMRNDGRTFPMRATLGLVHGSEGTWIAIALQDISDEIEAEAARRRNDALEAQAQERRRFLSRMSHELRTPLNAVLGFTQLLRRQDEPMSPNQQRAIERIEMAGQHLLGMVNDLMDLSKLDLGGIHIESRVFDLGDEWPQAVALVLPMARARNVTIRSPRYDGAQTLLWTEAEEDQSSGSAWVKADPMRVRQILVNLMSNAIKYNRDDGGMSIEIRQTDTQVRISIVDTGYGLSQEQLAHIGEPFNRLGAEQSGIDGSGLGLALSRNLALKMNGELLIESAVGFGTRATLVLQRATATHAPAPADDTAHHDILPPLPTGRRCILHVEDDPVNIELVGGLLAHSRPNIDYLCAISGKRALELLRDCVPDLILTDMDLGDMTGLALLAAIRRDARLDHVPVIAVSGDAMTDSVSRAREAGFADYLTKPIEFTEFLNTVDAAIAPQPATAHAGCPMS